MSTTQTYRCISSYAFIKSSPSLFSSTLGSLKKEDLIEVISINGLWAYFKYNNKNAYTLTMYLQKVEKTVTGSITIRYLNIDTKAEIAAPITNNNLTLKSYTFTAPSIANYTVVDPSSKSVTLTTSNPNQEVIFYYKENKVYGSITIRYVDKATNAYIAESKVYKNLELGTYSYDAINISGYKLSGDSSKSVTLTKEIYDVTITFEYNKILGEVSIQYIDIDTKKDIAPTESYSSLELSDYSYNAKTIAGYTISGDSTKSVTLTDNTPSQTVIFEYVVEEIIEPLDPSKQNEVPYISTYYIKPVVKPDEEVIIDYYITDYYHKEYVNEDYSEVFKVTVRIEGKDDIIVRNLMAGDHSVSLGTFPNLDGQEQKFSILCTDKYGRNSHELFNFFLVRNDIPIKEYIMTTNDLINYNISNINDTTKLISTREGLQKLLDDKQAQRYNRLRLLAGTYRIDHLAPIYIPTRFTLDMNGATLKLHEFTGDKALMMELNNTFDSHAINGTIEGDFYNHDYANSSNDSEWVHGISIGGESKYSSYENLTIKDITGYGTINGIKASRDGKIGYTYWTPSSSNSEIKEFKLGDINRNSGLDIESTNRTTCNFKDITGYSEIGYLSISIYLGYQGNPCGTWNLICHFYDENKNFIKSTDAYQYRRVAVPSNAKFMRVTILNEAYPTNLSIQLFRLPTNCQFKNLKLNNCRAVGIAPQGMNNMLFEDCELTKCGSAVTKCALDAEDGWDMMQDVTFRKLNFHDNPYNEFLTCAGHNFIVEDMVNGHLYIWGRTKDLVIRNSNLKNCYLGYNNLVRTGICRFSNNNVLSVIPVEDASLDNIILKNTTIVTLSKSTAYNCIITGSASDNVIVYKSRFINNNGYMHSNIYIYDSIFESDGNQKSTNLNFNQLDAVRVFTNCTFTGFTSICGNYCNSSTFNNCTFDNMYINPNQPNTENKFVFNNCNINYISGMLLVVDTITFIEFHDCTITQNYNNSYWNTLVFLRKEPSGGKITFTNCSITKEGGYILDGEYTPGSTNLNASYEVVLNNSPVDIQLLSDRYKNSTLQLYKVTVVT